MRANFASTSSGSRNSGRPPSSSSSSSLSSRLVGSTSRRTSSGRTPHVAGGSSAPHHHDHQPHVRELRAVAAGGGSGGLDPVFLAEWIAARSEEVGSIYLVPFEGGLSYRYNASTPEAAQSRVRYMTLSCHGLNEFCRGEVRFVTTEEWLREYDLYSRLKRVSLFNCFRLTKTFQTWKRVVKRQKFASASRSLVETSAIFGDVKMRDCFLQVHALVGRLADMGIAEVQPRKTYYISDFFARQEVLVSDFGRNFGDFRNRVRQLVLDTCKAIFQEKGFDYDSYESEVAWTFRAAAATTTVASSTLSSSCPASGRSSTIQHHREPRKMTFMEQVNKRKVCEQLSSFIRLIDYMLRLMLHSVASNSLVAIYQALTSRSSRSGSKEDAADTAQARRRVSQAAEVDGAEKVSAEGREQEVPVFNCQVSVSEVGVITITPSQDAFEDRFRDFLAKINAAVRGIPLLLDDPGFHPFTQPILYGKMETAKQPDPAKAESSSDGRTSSRGSGGSVLAPGGGGLLAGHHQVCQQILEDIQASMRSAFADCDSEMAIYKKMASEFYQVDGQLGPEGQGEAAKLVDVETDVDSLKARLSDLTEQQALAKGIQDSQVVSLFKADFRPLKRIVMPNISKTIVRMQDALPKLGREKMVNFNEECKAIKDLIDFEFRTTEDYVENMDMAEKLERAFRALKLKLEDIQNVYLIMKNIPVPVSTEDSNSLKGLSSQLSSIRTKVHDKVREHANLPVRFEAALEEELGVLRSQVANLFQEVRSPVLLELESTVEEVRPVLAKLEAGLGQARARVLQYNGYEQAHGLPFSEHLDLVAAEMVLAALKTVWRCTEEWDQMYSQWATAEFSSLDVEELIDGTGLVEFELEEARETLGPNPMASDLSERVERTKRKIPVLTDLRAEALRDRHWKAISEVVGADLSGSIASASSRATTSAGKKVTIEVLDKYRVFDYAAEIARIVRTAALEQQLDSLVDDLRRTWTERRLDIRSAHGFPTVVNFRGLFEIIDSSLATLKELGSSRYSEPMKEDLLKWCKVVANGEVFLQVLKETQELWMGLEVPLTSMVIQETAPAAHSRFQALRSRLLAVLQRLEASGSLLAALSEKADLMELEDLLASFKSMVEEDLSSVLWNIRMDSPLLFFLPDTDLLQTLCHSHNNLPELHKYLDRIFPWFSSMILVENTNLAVTKMGYHPEVAGIMSKDGETITFSEVMKVRLGVDHWIKCLGLHVKATLRDESRKFPLQTSYGQPGMAFRARKPVDPDLVVTEWETSTLPTQILIAGVHTFWCNFFRRLDIDRADVVVADGDVVLNHEDDDDVDDKDAMSVFRRSVLKMEEHCISKMKEPGMTRLMANREVAKLFLMEYYSDLIAAMDSPDGQSCRSILDKVVVKYSWEPIKRLLACSTSSSSITPSASSTTPSSSSTTPSSVSTFTSYGYEYHGQEVTFTPLLAADRLAFSILRLMVQGHSVCVLKRDVRKSLFRSLANIHGRRLCFLRPEVNPNFQEALVGGVVTNSWLFVEELEFLQLGMTHHLNFLMELALRIDNARMFRQDHLEILGDRRVALGRDVFIFLAGSNLYSLLCQAKEDCDSGDRGDGGVRPDSRSVASVGVTANTLGLERYRQVCLVRPPTTLRVRMAFINRGIVDNLSGVYLCSLLEKVHAAFSGQGSALSLEMKMLNAIGRATNPTRNAVVQHFLSLGVAETLSPSMNVVLDVDLVELLTQTARISKKFRTFFQGGGGGDAATSCWHAAASATMVENCMRLQKSVSGFPITCVVADDNTATTKRSLSAMESFLSQQTGCRVYRVCARTQLGNPALLEKVFAGARQDTGIFHVTGRVPIDQVHVLRTVAAEFPTLKVLFSCADPAVLGRIEQDVHCVPLDPDPRFELLSTILPHLEPPELAKLVDKAFDDHLKAAIAQAEAFLTSDDVKQAVAAVNCPRFSTLALCVPVAVFLSRILSGILGGLQVAADDGFATLEALISPAEYSKAVVQAVWLFLHDRIDRVEGNEKHHGEMDMFWEPSDGAFGLDLLLEMEPKVAGLVRGPEVNYVDGALDFYIPSRKMTRVVALLHFYLSRHVPVLLLGPKGCGKSLAFSQAASCFPTDFEVKFINMSAGMDRRQGASSGELRPPGHCTDLLDYEVSLLEGVRNPSRCVVVAENFDVGSDLHVHFVSSLMGGRVVLDARQDGFRNLCGFVVFAECIAPEGHDDAVQIPEVLASQMVIIEMGSDEAVFEEMIEAAHFTSARYREAMVRINIFLQGWHRHLRDRATASPGWQPGSLVRGNLLHRVFIGVVSEGLLEEEVDDEDDGDTAAVVSGDGEARVPPVRFLQHAFNEILQEYFSFFAGGMEECLEALEAYDRRLDPGLRLGAARASGVVSLYHFSSPEDRPSGAQPGGPHNREDAAVLGYTAKLVALPEAILGLFHSYQFSRGKAFNNRLVFSEQFARICLAVFRSLSRFGNLILVGPPGCGKASVVSFCAQYMGFEGGVVVHCGGGHRRACGSRHNDDFDRLRRLVREAYLKANHEGSAAAGTLLHIPVPSSADDNCCWKVLDYLDRILYYYDIPEENFSKRDKMDQLFSSEEAETAAETEAKANDDRFRALLDQGVMDEAVRNMRYRIQDNLRVVVSMTPEVFERTHLHYSNLYAKCGVVRMTPWNEETLVAIAEDRFAGLEGHADVAPCLRSVAEACAAVHHLMAAEVTSSAVSTTQYLDMVRVLPQLLRPLQQKLTKTRAGLQQGVDMVIKANAHISKLTAEIAEKEPEVQKLKVELEQLNKRLSQERINLDRASKAFRKKEVAARKKSEETQELAADAHRNLEHAMPALEAATQAINSIDKNDIFEIRSIKNPSEAVQQVLEAVCILLGVKADWPTAKVLLADPSLPQKLLEFDKDNIPEHVSKRVRRYIDNPKFIPDEVGKVSRACCSLCMWVRAIDLYSKIFKSIEPKRVRLLQSESELADLMAALRAETDRVAHIESTMASLQSRFQDKVKRRSAVEASLRQKAERLARAQVLSYSLEEECDRWKESLAEADGSLRVLVGNSLLAAATTAYMAFMGQTQRMEALEKCRQVCQRFNIPTGCPSFSASEFLLAVGSSAASGSSGGTDVVASSAAAAGGVSGVLKGWLGKFEFYNENYLSVRTSNKWSLLVDPHGLALEAFRMQNPEGLVVVDSGDSEDKLVKVLTAAVMKGHEVLVTGFEPHNYPESLRDVFERRTTERIHAFVGLMGVPIMRKDIKVNVAGKDLVCSPRFRLLCHTHRSWKDLPDLQKFLNVVNFDYSAEALNKKLVEKTMGKADPGLHRAYEESKVNIDRLELAVADRKRGVLDILLKRNEDDILDDKALVTALKDAKAKVFEMLNDLNMEKKNMASLTLELPPYREAGRTIRSFTHLLDLLKEVDASCVLPKTSFIDLMDRLPDPTTGDEGDEEGPDRLRYLKDILTRMLDLASDLVLPSLSSKNRYVFHLGCNLIVGRKAAQAAASEEDSLLGPHEERLLVSLIRANSGDSSIVPEARAALDAYMGAETFANREAVRTSVEALINRDESTFAEVVRAEEDLVLRVARLSAKRPLLIFHDDSNVVNACDMLLEMALRLGGAGSGCPHYVSADPDDGQDLGLIRASTRASVPTTVASLNLLMAECKRSGRWIIVDNFHAVEGQQTGKLVFPEVDDRFRVFLLSRHSQMTDFPLHGRVDAISLTHSPSVRVEAAIFKSLLTLDGGVCDDRAARAKERLVRLHVEFCRRHPPGATSRVNTLQHLQALTGRLQALLEQFDGRVPTEYYLKVKDEMEGVYGVSIKKSDFILACLTA